jgi:hypothetical protein
MTFQELLAAQVASGGQNVITPDNAGRILGLAAQQEANRRLALAEGQQAVQERKNLQAMQAGMTPGEIAGTTVVAPSGARFVTDAQGNVVGMNAPVTPLGPKQYAGESMQEARQAFNRGESTQAERDAFRQNMFGDARSPGLIQKTFIQEMQKQAPKPQVPAPSPPQPPPPAPPPQPPPPPTPEEAKKMQENKVRLENLFSASALPSGEQKTEDKSRADMYREMQKLQGELSSGSRVMQETFPGEYGSDTMDIPVQMTPQMRAEAQQRVDQLREEIAKSGKRSSGIAAKTATPKAKLEEYRALLEALARAQQ